MKKRVIIVGGGASGMAAAIKAAERGFFVTVLEKKEQPGKKLLVTGNGHCNISNSDMSSEHYRSDEMPFIERFLPKFTTEDSKAFFSSLGLLETERGGLLYPASMQAASVLSVLTGRMKDLGVEILTDITVLSAEKKKSGFLVRTDHGVYECDGLILAMGTPAGVRDKKPYNGYELLKKLGHHVIDPRPALTGISGNEGCEKIWAGVRTQAKVRFLDHEESGELQLTEDGISGILVFQISRFVAKALADKEKPEIRISFLPDHTRDELLTRLETDGKVPFLKSTKIEDYLKGWLPKKLIPVILRRAGIHGAALLSELPEKDRENLAGTVKDFVYHAAGTGDAASAQVFMGGCDLREINDTFESRKVPGLYITGELLDCDGKCGGYNLHFAFGSGIIAGNSIFGERE